ncbi:MAG: TonB family protein [Synergistaceae bacterium]|jgi:protein TonB|nr:TonB family protein [Synergistaceae bacterium]
MSLRRTPRWAAPLSASLAVHTAAFFGLFYLSPPVVVTVMPPAAATPMAARGVTVALRRLDGPLPAAAVSAGMAVNKGKADKVKTVPQTAAPPKKNASPSSAKVNEKAGARSGAKKVNRAPARAAKLPAGPENSASESAALINGTSKNSARSGISAGGAGTAAGAETGSGRILGLSDLRVLRRVKPDYPAIARKRKEEGTVTLLITLEGGNVLSVKVEKSSGFSALDGAAAAAVRRWRFEVKNAGMGRASKIQARVPVTFRLNSN